MKKSFLKGSCGCQNVKYRVNDKPLFTQACHCKDCKKSTGSSFVIHTMVLEKDLEVNDLDTLLKGLKLVGDYLDKTILRPNNLNFPNSRLLFLNTLK